MFSASAFAAVFSSVVRSSRASISSIFFSRAASIAFLASGFLTGSGLNEFTSLKPDILFTSTLISVSAPSIACLAASAFALASSLATIFSSAVRSSRASISASLALSASSTAFLAAGFATGVGFTLFTSVVPLALAWSTPASVVALSIASFAASAFAFASAFAAVFSSSVKSLFASIASFLAFNASSIAFLAAGFATGVGFTLFTSIVPLTLACSTPAFVVALSIACFAASAFAFASSLAAVFSSSVKSLFASIALILSANASSTAFFASGFATGVGFTESTLVAPSFLA